MSAASWACPRPSTTTCSALTTAPATPPPPSISRPASMEVARDSRVYNIGQITIIECMGRHAGWLTAAAALANAKEPCVRLHLSARGRLRHGQVHRRRLRVLQEERQLHRRRLRGHPLRRRPLRLRGEDRRDRRLRPCPARRSGRAPGQCLQGKDRREGSRHRTEPAPALRRALRLSDRHRRVVHVRQDRC